MSHFPNRPTTRGKIVDRTFRQLERVVRQQHETLSMTVVDLIGCINFTLALRSRHQ
jgi:hypothetical protein